MEKVSKRSGGKVRCGDVLVMPLLVCIEVQGIEALSDETSLVSGRVLPGQQETFVDAKERLVLASAIEAKVHVKKSKRYLTKGNAKEIDAQCRQLLELRQQLNGSQQGAKAHTREVPSPPAQ